MVEFSGIGAVPSEVSEEAQRAAEEYRQAHEKSIRDVLEKNAVHRFGEQGESGFIRWQVGPHADGRNGVEVDEAIDAIIERMEFLQTVGPCRENAIIITHLEEALMWVRRRRELRDTSGVRGSNAAHQSIGQRKTLDDYGWEAPPIPEFFRSVAGSTVRVAGDPTGYPGGNQPGSSGTVTAKFVNEVEETEPKSEFDAEQSEEDIQLTQELGEHLAGGGTTEEFLEQKGLPGYEEVEDQEWQEPADDD